VPALVKSKLFAYLDDALLDPKSQSSKGLYVTHNWRLLFELFSLLTADTIHQQSSLKPSQPGKESLRARITQKIAAAKNLDNDNAIDLFKQFASSKDKKPAQRYEVPNDNVADQKQ
jgi:hypothetical protein